MVLRKDQLEASLRDEKQLIEDGRLKEDNPLDVSENYCSLCEACRRGDLKVCQEMITEGANINARDPFDYSPLILASLCGHYEVVQLLLESGALCERDTFQGERCLYNALNDRIRNLLLSYDYSKSTDPLQPLASHITSLLNRSHPQTSDIVVTSAGRSFNLHKFILSARSLYFRTKLSNAPDTVSWKLPSTIPPQAFEIAVRWLYLGEFPSDVGGGAGTGFTEQEILEGVGKISKQLEIRSLWDGILDIGDRRLARQRRTEELERARNQIEAWVQDNVLRHKVIVDMTKAKDIKWDKDNGIFADVLLQADQPTEESSSVDGRTNGSETPPTRSTLGPLNGIPVGPLSRPQRSPSRIRASSKSTLFPAHRAMLIRSEFFNAMFSSNFREAQHSPHLHIIPLDCSPEVLQIVITFLYTEKADIPLNHAVDVLYAADLLFIEKLKVKATVVINTIGNANKSRQVPRKDGDGTTNLDTDPIDIYDVIRAGWLTRVPRLEEFAARYIAYRLEDYIEEEDFADLIRESANRIQGRQETDSIELLDDIRFYLSERFRLRFEDIGLDDIVDESTDGSIEPAYATDIHDQTNVNGLPDESLDVDESDVINHTVDETANGSTTNTINQMASGAVRTLDGKIAGDEFASDAINYQILLEKIDALLERLKLDA